MVQPFRSVDSFNPHKNLMNEAGIFIIILTSQIRKLRHRGVKLLVHAVRQ